MNTTYFLNLIMGNLFHCDEDPSIPAQYYVGLSATKPTIDGICTGEPLTGTTGYKRVLLSNLSQPQNGVITNTVGIDFDESLTSWGTVYYYVVYDAAIDGNLLFFGELSSPITVDANTIMTIKSGDLSLTLSNPA